MDITLRHRRYCTSEVLFGAKRPFVTPWSLVFTSVTFRDIKHSSTRRHTTYSVCVYEPPRRGPLDFTANDKEILLKSQRHQLFRESPCQSTEGTPNENWHPEGLPLAKLWTKHITWVSSRPCDCYLQSACSVSPQKACVRGFIPRGMTRRCYESLRGGV